MNIMTGCNYCKLLPQRLVSVHSKGLSVHQRCFKYNRRKINLRDKENIARWRAKLKLSFRQIIGVAAGCVTGCACFVGYVVWSLERKLKLTNDVHKKDGSDRFIYPDRPIELTRDDVFPDTFERKVKYKYVKLSEKVLPWLQSKSHDPAVILRLTESSDAYARRLGLKTLTADNDWEDFQYRCIAQACSNRTMASLARIKDSDKRLFRPMPWLPPAPEASVEDDLRTLLSDLQRDVRDEAIKQFTARVLTEGQPKNIVETGQWCHGGTPLQFVKSITDETDGRAEIWLMEALASHSQLPEQCIKIVEGKGLQLMQRVLLSNDKKVDFKPILARLLANISLNTNLHKHIIDGGWAAVLHQWMTSNNTTVFFHTARALANLDRDLESTLNIPAFYEDGVFPAYPVYRSTSKKSKIAVDIVFIHGLSGGPFKTWRQEDRRKTEETFVVTEEVRQSHTFFWPKDWLAPDLKEARILNVGFDTDLTTWNLKYPTEAKKRTLHSRSAVMIDKLKRADVGSRPVLWVGHSMGGLLIKEMLQMSKTDPKYMDMLRQTIGILFYSVPHQGASLANLSKFTKYMVNPSIEVQELDSANAGLKELHRSFVSTVYTEHIPVKSFGEADKTDIGLTIKVHIVPQETADPGIGDFHLIKADHITVCKPKDKDSALYKETLNFIKECIYLHSIKTEVKSGIDHVKSGVNDAKRFLKNLRKGSD